MKDGVAMGYLLDSYGSERDCWAHDGKVVISHGCVLLPKAALPSPSIELTCSAPLAC